MIHVVAPTSVSSFPTLPHLEQESSELIVLGRQFDDLAPLEDAAWCRREDLEEAITRPPAPAELFSQGADFFNLPVPEPGPGGRFWFGNDEMIARLRSEPRVQHIIAGGTPTEDGGFIPREVPNPRAQARADEVVAAYDRWREDVAAAEEAIGLAAAIAQSNRLSRILKGLRKKVAAASAQTIEEFKVKARVSAWYIGGGTLDDIDIDDTGTGIALSIVRDLIGGRPPADPNEGGASVYLQAAE